MYLTIRGSLGQHGPCASVRSVDLQYELDFRVGHDENRGGGEASFQGCEGGVGFGCPAVDVSTVNGGTVELKPPDKPPIKVGKSKESLKLPHCR